MNKDYQTLQMYDFLPRIFLQRSCYIQLWFLLFVGTLRQVFSLSLTTMLVFVEFSLRFDQFKSWQIIHMSFGLGHSFKGHLIP